ncbi:MAG TPA: GntR family transcriptional regulator [Sulfurospirillum arcachonense]|nr:GntR family transcriptional regulator [Sulfurospirillum arcachonense]HIP44439.1 GntR family transcriptional regulator [Sulfurospirillum arcachonense]
MSALLKQPLKEKIIEHIYNAIVNEEYIGGSQIKELHLSEKLKVSRAPIREALLELVSLGVLEQIARKGVFVKEITSKDIYDTYESKGVIEGFLATEFALHATSQDIEQLSLHVEQMSNPNSDRKKVVKVGEEFHKLTLKYAKNSVFLETLEKINKKSQLLFYKNWTKMYSQVEVKQRHQKIVDAIISRDKKTIEDVIREHYFETGTKIILLREVR